MTAEKVCIRQLDKATYAGQQFTVHYTTGSYLDIVPSDSGFALITKDLAAPEERSFKDCIMNEWLENPIAFGAFENERLIGYVEGSLETWNNRFRISNIAVFDNAHRHRGIGAALMTTILDQAQKSGARMAVLETQTCNEKAIAFYRKNGFQIIGFDLYAYTNSDPERHEIRIEMGKKLSSV